LERAEEASAGCASLNDGNVPFREIVEFEVLRGTLARFKSDLMLTEGKVQPALEMQKQSLRHLTDALNKYPSNADIQTAYYNCSNRLQTVLSEQGNIGQAKQLAREWLELAQSIQKADYRNLKTREFVLLAQHTMGHLSEATLEPQQAQGYYREALSTVGGLLSESPDSQALLAQTIELNVHMIRFEIQQSTIDIAESYLDAAIDHSVKLKSLPEPNPKYVGSIKNQMQVALRILEGSEHREQKQRWERRIRESGVVP
jgi:tetratricopeptide (TPR) repeat protein